MHKITKGLKKKKKGKKSKHKEEELFTQEELEAYRREHQQQVPDQSSDSAPPANNEEWKKFSALTAEVDDILKKTQGDLDRIKSTSFFKRIPPPSELEKQKAAEQREEKAKEPELTEEEKALEAAKAAIVPVSESESEEEDDDIFDTAYIDVLAAAEVKLAYIPESPTEEQTGDDPFDTSIAERAILGPAVERKGKKLVPLGSAVEVLTGRVQAPTCVPIKRPNTRRQVLKEKDLIFGSFDENVNLADIPKDSSPTNAAPSLLDDEAPPIDDPIDLSKSLYQPPVPQNQANETKDSDNNIVKEFDTISKNVEPIEDEDDLEFAVLAAESLSKAPIVTSAPVLPSTIEVTDEVKNWKPFENENQLEEDEEIDPFDTSFANNILPGKAELKVIESEILNEENDILFDPRKDEKYSHILESKVKIHLTNPTGQRESISSLDRVSESELNFIKPSHRDLLGGSITDLSNFGEQPLKPTEKVDENYIEYSDPFDTSIVDIVTVPGQTELKFLEKELLSDIKTDQLSDDEFDPRAEENAFTNKPDIVNANQPRKVSFDLPLSDLKPDLLATGEEISKVCKPLTPYYVRTASIPEQDDFEQPEEDIDPFDTSYISNLAPGKAEIKIIESELFDPKYTNNLTDSDFNPRDDKQVAVAKVVQTIQEITSKPKKLEIEKQEPVDLLAADISVNTKVLTPAAEVPPEFGEEISYSDPFDTSIACNILPGKTELKLLESELIQSNDLEDPDFDPRSEDTKEIKKTSLVRQDLFDNFGEAVGDKPLTPIVGSVDTENFVETEDFDPFDTSIANNLAPGRTEIKLLESELM